MLLLMTLLPFGMWAQNYDLWVNGIQVTEDNRNDVTSAENNNGDPQVTYNPETFTLILDNATLTGTDIYHAGILSGLNSLTISIKGENTIVPNDSCTAIRANAEGAQTLTIVKGSDNCSLSLNSSRPIRDFNALTLTGVHWNWGEDYTYGIGNFGYGNGYGLIGATGGEADNVTLSDEALYPPSMFIAGMELGFEYDNGNKLFYAIDYADTSLEDVAETELNIQEPFVTLLGPCTVTAYTQNGDFKSTTVKGKLFGLSETSLSTVLGKVSTLQAPTLQPSIEDSDGLTCQFSSSAVADFSNIATINEETGEITVNGAGSVSFAVNITDKSQETICTVLNQNDLTFTLTVADGYPIQINNGETLIQITEENRKHVLGENNTTVQFDGKNTLILNGANIAGITIESTDLLPSGLNVYLKGNNAISGTYIIDSNGYNDPIPVTFTTNEVTPGNLTFTYVAGAAALNDVDGAFRSVTTSYKNGLTATLDHNMEGNQVVTLSVTLKPIIVAETGENGVTFAGDGDDSNGKGLGEDIQGVGDPESPSEKAVEVNNIYYTLGTGDGYYVDAERDNLKIVALNTKMTGVPNYLPGTAEFLANFKGMTFLLPAGTGTVTVEACTYGGGILNVQIGDDAPVQFTDLTNFTECKVPYVITEPTYVFIYNSAPAASSRTFDDRRAPGRKETTTVGIGGLNISASSVDAVPEPALSPKMLDKSLVATWISGNHVTVNDTDVEDLNDDVFDDLTGGAAASRRAIAPSFITYVDLTGTAIKNKEVDRTALPFSKLNENTFIYMPAGNTIKAGTKNVVIGSVCDEMELKQENQLEVAKNFTALEASLDRTFDTEKTGTIYLPFALKEEKATEMGKFYELTSYDGSTVSMTSVASTKANTPYMFKPAKITLSAEMVDVKKDVPASPTAGGITFKGTYESKSIVSDGSTQYYCFMADGEKDGKFVHVTGTPVTVSPYRAYMVKSGASARDLDVIIDGFATGVSVVKDIRSKMDNVFYDLSGRRVMYPTKGLYIVNGKKVIIK